MTNVIDIIRSRKPKPHARGEGIRTAKAYRETHAGLLWDQFMAEMVADIEMVLSEPLDGIDMTEEQANRIKESF